MSVSVFSYPAFLRKCAVSDGLPFPPFPSPWDLRCSRNQTCCVGAVWLAVAWCSQHVVGLCWGWGEEEIIWFSLCV